LVEREGESQGKETEVADGTRETKGKRKRGKQGRKRRPKAVIIDDGLGSFDTIGIDLDLEQHLKKSCPSLPVHNFSSRSFAPVFLAVLGLGLKFVPKALFSRQELYKEIDRSIDGLKRRLDLAFWFGDDMEIDPFIPRDTHKRKWHPPHPNLWPPDKRDVAYLIKQVTDEARRDAKRILRLFPQSYTQRDKRLAEILEALAADDSIIIKPADKNLGIVIMNRADYVKMVMTHLDDVGTYTKVDNFEALAKDYYKQLRDILAKAGHIDDALAKALLQIPVEELHAAVFYCLPKIHKWKDRQGICPGRPIASTIGTHSEATSKYLDKKLRQVVNHFQGTVCTSSQQLILKMEDLNTAILSGQPLPTDVICFCADISALYPSIPITFGIRRVRQMCERTGLFSAAELDFLMNLLSWVLNTNVVEFGGAHFLQTKGTAMGTPVAVVYSIIVLCSMEEEITKEMTFYTRFIDDIFALCTTSQAETFIDAFNLICPDIQLDADSITLSKSGVFLDMNLFIRDNKTIGYSIFQKVLNIYQYIPPFSAHSPHVFNAFILNELKRYRLMCSEDSDYKTQVSRFYERLLQRGYSAESIHNARVSVPTRSDLLAVLLARREKLSEPTVLPHQLSKSRPILVACLPQFHSMRVGPSNSLLAFSLPKLVRLPPQLTSLPRYKATFDEGPVLLAHKNLKNINSILVSSRYHP